MKKLILLIAMLSIQAFGQSPSPEDQLTGRWVMESAKQGWSSIEVFVITPDHHFMPLSTPEIGVVKYLGGEQFEIKFDRGYCRVEFIKIDDRNFFARVLDGSEQCAFAGKMTKTASQPFESANPQRENSNYRENFADRWDAINISYSSATN